MPPRERPARARRDAGPLAWLVGGLVALTPALALANKPPVPRGSGDDPSEASREPSAPEVVAEIEPGPAQDAAPASTRDGAVDAPPGLTLRLGPGSSLALFFGASYWARGELRASGTEAAPRFEIPQRVRASIGAQWRGISTFVQFQDVRRWGTAPGYATSLQTGARPSTGVHQGYVQLEGRRARASGFLRLGRQELALGSMRFLGNAPWSPTMQSFDGLRAHGELDDARHGRYGVDLSANLVTAPLEFDRARPNGGLESVRTSGEWFGSAMVFAKPHPAAQVEAYAFVDTKSPTPEAPERSRTVVTPGLRVHGEPWRGLEYDLEGYAQSGRFDGQLHRAWSGAATVHYAHGVGERPEPGRLDPRALRPGVMATAVFASGEGCEIEPDESTPCGDGTHRAFDSTYGSRHRYLGYADWFAPTNVRAVGAGPELDVGAWLTARVHGHLFWFDQPDGVWKRANLSTVGAGWDPGARDRFAGGELDLRLQFRPWAPLGIDTGYSVFVPGGTGAARLDARPQHFAYLLVSAVF